MKIAFISGTSVTNSRLFTDWEPGEKATPHGVVPYRRFRGTVLINRHGREGKTPPHAINHRANIQALADLGFTDVVSLCSVGSLDESLGPGSLVSCSDYVSFFPATFSDVEGCYETPFMANNLLPLIREAFPQTISPEKTYVQMRGPRFETPAEVRVIRAWGDVVGMNLASEADLCREAGIRLTSLCMVDNHANGIGGQIMDAARFPGLVARNQETVNALFRAMLEALPI